MVSERLNSSKPSPDVKGGKLPVGAINNNKDLDVDIRREEPSFFGSFFSSAKNAPKKKGVAVMESVSMVESALWMTYSTYTLAPRYHPAAGCSQ